jgi:hypothetical protein
MIFLFGVLRLTTGALVHELGSFAIPADPKLLPFL